jgi:hypothetical protein
LTCGLDATWLDYDFFYMTIPMFWQYVYYTSSFQWQLLLSGWLLLFYTEPWTTYGPSWTCTVKNNYI